MNKNSLKVTTKSLIIGLVIIASIFITSSVLFAENFIYGDANGDGRVTSTDLAKINRYLQGMDVTINLLASDVNQDKLINSTDENILNDYILGKIKELHIIHLLTKE